MEHFDVKSKNPQEDIITPDEMVKTLDGMLSELTGDIENVENEIAGMMEFLMKVWKEKELADSESKAHKFMEIFNRTGALIDRIENSKKELEGAKQYLEKIKTAHSAEKERLLSVGEEREN